jgi:hypothetical protein
VLVIGLRLLLIAGPWLGGSHPAFAYEVCPAIPNAPVQVVLDTHAAPALYSRKLSYRELTARTPGPLRSRTLGLTQVQQSFSVQLQGKLSQARGGGVCFFLDQVKAALAYDKIGVFIAREYAPGSCEYEETKRHENLHVVASMDAMKQVLPRLRFTLLNAPELRQMGRVQSDSDREAKDKVMKAVRRLAQPYLEEIRIRADRRNAEIDSPESYRSVRARCTNW